MTMALLCLTYMAGWGQALSPLQAEQSLLMRQLKDAQVRLSRTGPRVLLLLLPPLFGPIVLLENETVVLRSSQSTGHLTG